MMKEILKIENPEGTSSSEECRVCIYIYKRLSTILE